MLVGVVAVVCVGVCCIVLLRLVVGILAFVIFCLQDGGPKCFIETVIGDQVLGTDTPLGGYGTGNWMTGKKALEQFAVSGNI